MATKSFSFFSSLPLELRREIYMLATPPRIVHVQEEPEDQEDFEETFGTMPVQLKLDPALAHFAFNWRWRIPRYSTQPTLESYGFTGGKAPYRPWNPSSATPEIPLNWLGTQPRIAWELIREGYLYSKAPIPALLHMCAESRAALMSCGYQLAFRTRSNGPRTWFNFERDVLYIGFDNAQADDYRSFLSGGPWDIGQFHPVDLKRVRKLALHKSGHLLSCSNSNADPAVACTRELTRTLQLFSGVTELLLVEWSREEVGWWSEFSADKSLSYPWNRRRTEQDTVDTLRELWCCIAVEEIDALLSLMACNEKYRTELSSTGDRLEVLKAHKLGIGDSTPYFQHLQLQLEQRLLEQRDTIVNASDDGSAASWEIPRIETVHVLPQSMAAVLWRERQIIWEEFSEMKRRQRDVPTPTPDIPRATVIQAAAMPESPLPFGQDDEEAFAEAHGTNSARSCCGQCEYGDYLSKMIESQKKWWVEEGMIPAPGYEIIY